MYQVLRSILFRFSPEAVHHFSMHALRLICSTWPGKKLLAALFSKQDSRLHTDFLGLPFRNPVGLAAGFDKNAVLFNELGDLGFGFVEIGTVTPRAQAGNPRKRLFRLIEDGGIINRMGFNNDGLQAAIEKLKSNKGKIIIGGNIGKNTDTSPENYTQDYK